MYRDLTDPNQVKMTPFEGERGMSTGASEYIGPGSDDKAGAGRGKQGGPTAEEAKEAKRKKSGGVISSASRRADGIATKGKTRGKFV
jgi:hypothetical protein